MSDPRDDNPGLIEGGVNSSWDQGKGTDSSTIEKIKEAALAIPKGTLPPSVQSRYNLLLNMDVPPSMGWLYATTVHKAVMQTRMLTDPDDMDEDEVINALKEVYQTDDLYSHGFIRRALGGKAQKSLVGLLGAAAGGHSLAGRDSQSGKFAKSGAPPDPP